ncbi:MAG TPA: DUF1697 domain-containing protein [Chloroflexota bacterium]|nr:DUF1697 domain-containing protein [Chloroflexota bacterium]
MTRYVAFLRGINVGGHTVKMDALKKSFEALGFENVSTFIASGNVIFEGGAKKTETLEQKIETALEKELGYEVATFLRTDKQVAEIAQHDAFSKEKAKAGDTQYVIFLKEAPDAATKKRVLALSNEEDVLRLHGAELYWLRRAGGLLGSTISAKQFEQALGKQPTTARNLNTIHRLSAKLQS